VTRVDILLTHLHMDHIQGLGFFEPLHRADLEIHIWGPASMTLGLRERLARYLSPPLFPMRLRDLPSEPSVHDVPAARIEIPGFDVAAALVCHPGPTVGYRVRADSETLAYLPDHEPMLCASGFRAGPRSTSGHDLAADVDLLIHDSQYTAREYADRVGWGHSAIEDAFAFAEAVGARRLMPFHHDPNHDDSTIDRMLRAASASPPGPGNGHVIPAAEGLTVDLASRLAP
jgi:ribonuclease BN (tRNA processing enzyme)